MSAKWFGGAARLAIVASAVACNAILGIQDLPPGAAPLEPLDAGASFGSCEGNVYKVGSGSLCGCKGAYFAVCDGNQYSQCSCTAPVGYTPAKSSVPEATTTEESGFEDFDAAQSFEDFDSSFEDAFEDFDSGGFEDFDSGGFEDFDSGFEDFDAAPVPPDASP